MSLGNVASGYLYQTAVLILIAYHLIASTSTWWIIPQKFLLKPIQTAEKPSLGSIRLMLQR